MKVLAVAPHPDDETLGCGGTLLRHIANGDEVDWAIITDLEKLVDCPEERKQTRRAEISDVARAYGFNAVNQLLFPTTRLDTIPMAELIEALENLIKKARPEVIYIPHRGDVHSDHRIVFDALMACVKWFRFDSVKRVLAYETPSETDFYLSSEAVFFPAVFVDISQFIDKKIEIMKIYASECGDHPFPRSERMITSLATVRGAAAGFVAAEAFMLLRERV